MVYDLNFHTLRNQNETVIAFLTTVIEPSKKKI